MPELEDTSGMQEGKNSSPCRSADLKLQVKTQRTDNVHLVYVEVMKEQPPPLSTGTTEENTNKNDVDEGKGLRKVNMGGENMEKAA